MRPSTRSANRPADRGRIAASRPGHPGRCEGESDRHAGARADRAARGALPRLAVRTVGRDVPARGDRPGARLPAAVVDRRRTDDRAGCHHPEGGPGPDGGVDPRDPDVGDPDHPRPRARRGLLRQRDGDGERPRGGSGGQRDDFLSTGARLYEAAAARDAPSVGGAARPLALADPPPVPEAAATPLSGRLLDVRGLVKTYGTFNAVDGIDLHVDLVKASAWSASWVAASRPRA